MAAQVESNSWQFDSTNNIYIHGDTLYIDEANNRVGINVAAPTVTFDVLGNSLFTGTVTITGDLAVDTSVLFVDVSEDRVGIGTATPATELEISSASPNLWLTDTNGTVTACGMNYYFYYGATPTLAGYVGYQGGDDLYVSNSLASGLMYLRTNNTTRVSISAAGETQIGTPGTNYSAFESDGTLEFNGTATVFRDINLAGAIFQQPAADLPDIDEFVDEGGADTGVPTYAFAVGEKVAGSFEMQHDYKEGSDITFHIHWQGIAAPSGIDYVRWQLSYTIAKAGETLDAVTTVSGEGAIGTQYVFVTTDIATISDATIDIGDQFLFVLERIASVGATYSGDALTATLGIHYECDTHGSRLIGTK